MGYFNGAAPPNKKLETIKSQDEREENDLPELKMVSNHMNNNFTTEE